MKRKATPVQWNFPEEHYEAWLSHVFDRPESKYGWYFDTDDLEFQANPSELLELTTRTFTCASTDLSRYSDKQVSDGLRYIVDSGCSDTVFALMNATNSQEVRVRLIESIEALYTGCFEQRCAPVLGHLSEQSPTPLNTICYMLWDISALAWWEDPCYPDRATYYAAIIKTLGKILRSHHVACVESALHGLGHIHSQAPEDVESTIAAFLKSKPVLPKALLSYAQNAAAGYVQ